MMGALPGAAHAVNRCTDANGKITFQDAACDSSASTRAVDTSDAFNTKPKSPAAASLLESERRRDEQR
jgi:hypothetical protein